MPKETFTVTLQWYSDLPTFGPALEAINQCMVSGRTLAELHAAGIAFRGDTAYDPHTTIAFEAETMAQGLKFADLITGVLHHAFPDMPWIYVKVGGRSAMTIVAEFEKAINSSVADLRDTRSFFASRAIRDVRLRLQNTLDVYRS